MKRTALITVASLLAVIASIFTFSYFQKGSNKLQNTINTTVEPKDTAQIPETAPEVPKILESDLDTSTWKTYRNEEFGFEFRHPANVEPRLVEWLRQEHLEAEKKGTPSWWNYFSKIYDTGPGSRPDRQSVYMDIPKVGYVSFNMSSLLVASKAEVAIWCESEEQELNKKCDTKTPLYEDSGESIKIGGLNGLLYGDIKKECSNITLYMKDLPNKKWNQFNSIVLDCYTPSAKGEPAANVVFEEMIKSIKFFKP